MNSCHGIHALDSCHGFISWMKDVLILNGNDLESYVVYDMLGNEIVVGVLTDQNEIDLDALLGSGVYIMQVKSSSGMISEQRFIKQ